MLFHPRAAIIDDFLSPTLLSALIDHALASEAAFRPARIYERGTLVEADARRRALLCDAGLGPAEAGFTEAVMAALPQLCTVTGVKPFTVARVETQLIASQNGGFFERHTDVLHGDARDSHGDRILSCVYYFHVPPRRFSGGALTLYRIGPGAAAAAGETINPEQNRIVAFPAFVPHEVQPVSCPDGEFAAARFSINCWLHRARA